MGEVYRSRDSKLGREVALKVLPSAVAADPDRLARFGREAKLFATLNHPNIAAIYGLEDSGNSHALVMELVEGPTLADRIKAGPIPSDEAPDGQWLSYVSGESGLPQVYVVPFPNKGGKWQISPKGGIEPGWSKNGHELFYSKMGTLMAEPYNRQKFIPGRSTSGNRCPH